MAGPGPTRLRAAVLLALVGGPAAQASAGVLDGFDLRGTPVRHALPARLAEISGLAVSADGRLFAHGDERAVVYELDAGSGRIVKRFWLGRSGIRGDFEGIAIAGVRFFLVDSRGTLYEFREGEDRQAVRYRAIATGLAGRCEVEGLATDPRANALLLACKTSSTPALSRQVVVWELALDVLRLRAQPRLRLPFALLARLGLEESFHASGIEVHPSGSLVLVAAREEAILEVSADGRELVGRRLDRRRHPQTEGIAFLPDGSLVLADEARGRGSSLSIYRPRAPAVGARP